MANAVDWDELDLRGSGSGYAFDADDGADGDDPFDDDDLVAAGGGGDDIKARLRETEAELAAERAARAEALKVQRGQELETLKAQEEELRRKRRQASDEDDWEAFDKIDSELGQVRYKRMRLEESREPAPEAAGQADPQAHLVPQARSWIKRNKAWFEPGGDQYDADKAKRAMAIAKELEGKYDLEDPELYRELDRQLNGQRRPNRRDQVAGDGRSMGAGRVPRRVGRPSAEERSSMQRYGLNPGNPRDVAAWRARNADLG